MTTESSSTIPEGSEPLFLTAASQKLFGLVPGEDFTLERPFKTLTKEEVLLDIEGKGVLSDFFGVRDKIEACVTHDLLMVYDEENQGKKNFLICLTEDARAEVLAKYSSSQFGTMGTTAIKNDGSLLAADTEDAVREESVSLNRDLLKVSITRKRREFGGPYRFTDSDAHDGLVECRQFKNPNFDLIRMQKDIGIQAVATSTASGVQTSSFWFAHTNKNVQTEAPVYTQELMQDLYKTAVTAVAPLVASTPPPTQSLRARANTLSASTPLPQFNTDTPPVSRPQTMGRSRASTISQTLVTAPQESLPPLVAFMRSVLPIVEEALYQNETMDAFVDDYLLLSEEDLLIGNKSENTIKEFQSFTDFNHSKNKMISCLDWQPATRGRVAVSCTEKVDMDFRFTSTINMPVILVWDFVDPIHPQLVLEAPSDVICFKFHPKLSNILVGGCVNGQVAFWDLSLTELQKSTSTKQAKLGAVSTTEDERSTKNGILVPFVISSSIEASHKKPVNDITWLHEKPTAQTAPSQEVTQFVTASGDGRILVWSIKEFLKISNDANTEKLANLTKFDLAWAPVQEESVTNPENSLTYPLSKTYFIDQTVDSQNILFGTDEGELFETSWGFKKVDRMFFQHFGPIVSIQQSPFFPDVFLSVGDWTINIWKRNLKTPLLSSPCAASYVTVARWSSQRPGVFFVGKSDGSLDVWDLVDRSHAPSFTQNICSPSAITSMEFFNPNSLKIREDLEGPRLLAVGDNQGRLHILEIPRSLTHKIKKEKPMVQNLFSREEKRVNYNRLNMTNQL